MNADTPPATDRTSRVITALSNEYCRAVIACCRGRTDPTVSFETLVHDVGRRSTLDPSTVDVHLHHHALPKLADAGLIEYDRTDGTVRYNEQHECESLLETVQTSLATSPD
ncbi:DUF7344 domain-containing protein [Halovivax gelatinilyticus]|uniref:DUF7344 domain-containing protein n=1 Tax=Halovivax gelatinilyticus TaxID=2961597 RepID=UPI0020CA45A4|nr:hypothetical protein [Halovivax gelatinilyticus]